MAIHSEEFDTTARDLEIVPQYRDSLEAQLPCTDHLDPIDKTDIP